MMLSLEGRSRQAEGGGEMKTGLKKKILVSRKNSLSSYPESSPDLAACVFLMLSYLAALGLPAELTPPGMSVKSSADDCGEYCSPAATVHGDPVRPPSHRPQLSRLLAR